MGRFVKGHGFSRAGSRHTYSITPRMDDTGHGFQADMPRSTPANRVVEGSGGEQARIAVPPLPKPGKSLPGAKSRG
jgi:hypothetical protein